MGLLDGQSTAPAGVGVCGGTHERGDGGTGLPRREEGGEATPAVGSGGVTLRLRSLSWETVMEMAGGRRARAGGGGDGDRDGASADGGGEGDGEDGAGGFGDPPAFAALEYDGGGDDGWFPILPSGCCCFCSLGAPCRVRRRRMYVSGAV